MTTHAVFVGGAPERHVGQVHASITITNDRDRILAEEGVRDQGRVRTVHLDQILVDTGATILCLPADVISELGLQLAREVAIETAAGPATTRLYEAVWLQIEDREGQFACLELPGGSIPLLGVTPLEVLGFEPDLRSQRLRKLPMGPEGSYLTA